MRSGCKEEEEDEEKWAWGVVGSRCKGGADLTGNPRMEKRERQ